MEATFTHVGITVSDLDASVKFYEEVFGFTCRLKKRFEPDFFAAAPTCYNLPAGTYSDMAFMVAPNDITIEMFAFKPLIPKTEDIPWNRPAWTHIALQVDDLVEFAKHMKAKGVRFCMEVMDRHDGGHWVFVLDPDGNMVEVAEPMRKK